MFSKSAYRSISFRVLFTSIIAVLALLGIRGIDAAVGVPHGIDDNVTALRLQVIPHSDRPGDQDIKLVVRDEVLALLRDQMQTPPESAMAMIETVAEQQPAIEARVATVLHAAGATIPFEIRLEHAGDPGTFGERHGAAWGTEGTAGVLRIVLGEGRGSNFWCVIFPNMCFVPDSIDEYFPLTNSGNVAEAAQPNDRGPNHTHTALAEQSEANVPDPSEELGHERGGKIEFRWRLWEQIEQSRATRMLRGLWENTFAALFQR